MSVLSKIYSINALDIPNKLQEACEEVDGEFPFHCDHKVITIDLDEHSNNAFVKWLKAQGMKIPKNAVEIDLAVQGS
jgi:hypothetical protein